MVGNGGYYPLQVRTVLERGELAFADMPLLFYLDAGIIKIITIFGFSISDQVIFYVVQFIDSLSITLLLIPLHKFVKLTNNTKLTYFQVIILLYGILTFYTLNLITTSQKNSLAIFFFVFSGYYLVKYLTTTEQKKPLILAIVFLLLTGLTHFGTFVFAVIYSAIYILIRYKLRALIPIIILVGSSLVLIHYFDSSRFDRLLSVGEEFFSRMPNAPQVIKLLLYSTLAFLAIKGYKKHSHHFNDAEKTIIKTLIVLLIVIPLPFINPQFTDRLSVFLFIPQVLLLLYFSPYMAKRSKYILSSLMGLVIIGSLLISMVLTPPEGMTTETVNDLEELSQYIPDAENTMIISRHNLEFWVAFKLRVSVAQESKFDTTLIENYQNIFIINQTKGMQNMHRPPGGKNGRSHFDEPLVPVKATLIGSSEYFELYRYK
jgi:hypothetical protein